MDGAVSARDDSRSGRRRSWRDRLLDLRDALLASPRFRRQAVAFPLTRPVARRRTQALFDLCAGFVYSQVLLACVRLDLFELLAREGPASAPELAARLGVPVENMRRLLVAAVSLELVSRRGEERFAIGPLGAATLGEDGIVEMVRHHAMVYSDLQDPVALLRGEAGGGTLSRFWGYPETDEPRDLEPEAVAAYSDLMAASQSFVAREVLDAYPFARHRRLLDVGGGDGSFLRAVAAGAPDLELALFDLPEVVQRAEERFTAAGLGGRVDCAAGDFLRDPLPNGADLLSLVRIVHDHDDDAAMALLRACRRALPQGGTLLLAEPMATTRGAERVAAYFSLYLLAMGSGRPRSPDELGAMLREAGFREVRRLRTHTPLLVRVIVAR